MNTTTAVGPTIGSDHQAAATPSWPRRFIGAVARPQSYRNIAYLLVALPLGAIWFTVLVSVLAAAASLLIVALVGVPLLVGSWYAIRVFANVERGVANGLLGLDLPMAAVAPGPRANLWVRFKAMSTERTRWQELCYLLLRFPVGVATFTVAVVAISAPLILAYAPIHHRYVDDSVGDWFWSAELARFLASAWSWALVPLGVLLAIGMVHPLNGLAAACARWTASCLGRDGRRAQPGATSAATR